MPRPLTSLRRFVASLRPLAAVSLLAWVSHQGWSARMCPSIPSWTLPDVPTKDIILTHTYSVQTAVTRRNQTLTPDQQKRQEWIAALDKMESLNPRAAIAGHKRVGSDDSPRIIGETRKYIRDFERLAMQTTTARELYDEMLKLYPDWINRGALWSSVLVVKPLV